MQNIERYFTFPPCPLPCSSSVECLCVCVELSCGQKWAEIRKDEEEPEAKKNLAEKMKNVEVKEIAIANTEAHVTRQIPPYNASATTPQEAYVLDEIILAGEWKYLQNIYYSLQKGADFSGYPTFIRNRIDRLKKIEVFIQI
ncbi:DNA-directed RNA polymerase I subunit RPA49 [Trifolium medium]|uniref:DNA-directed RNA polymerase I subunit RPA49 n=1 Tax=Trifolium medium TaxID=97028 RepID=A0A392M927_9FABA|nr:DNA-directed RNA polymerase I subunit RPA49 [Trifolium medium]